MLSTFGVDLEWRVTAPLVSQVSPATTSSPPKQPWVDGRFKKKPGNSIWGEDEIAVFEQGANPSFEMLLSASSAGRKMRAQK